VAIAIVNIQDQAGTRPAMIALACAGFVLYGALGCVGWHLARRAEPRVGTFRMLIIYALAMAALFVLATAIYTTMQVYYMTGHL